MTIGLAVRLRQARHDADMTQAAVAELAGVSQPTVCNWEQGKSEPTEEQLAALTEILDLDGDQDDVEQTEGASAFGEWLARTRTEKGLSKNELARASGVTYVQICNIEAGRTQNPRVGTRERLAGALKEEVPESTVAATKEAASIKGVGEFVDFDPHDPADLPDEAGIYVFYDISERPVYVGQSGRISNRIEQAHWDKFWFRPPIVHRAACVQVEDKALRVQIEQILIRFLRSNAVINKQHVRRSADTDE